MSEIDQTQELLNEARDLMESFDDCAAMTVGYDKKEYTLTAKQMTLIAGALYLADCKLNQNKEDERSGATSAYERISVIARMKDKTSTGLTRDELLNQNKDE